jgi:transposase
VLNTNPRLAVDSFGMPVRALVTEGTTADCTQAIALIDGFDAEHLLADRGYDTNSILEHVERQGISAVIPPKRNRKAQRAYDKDIYSNSHN